MKRKVKCESVPASICVGYSVRNSLATVSLETYGGDEAKMVIENKLAQAPAEHLVRQAELSQGKRNKDKWAWTLSLTIDKSDSNLVKWYVDSVLAFYSFIES